MKLSDKEEHALILAEPKIFIWRTALFFLALTSLRIQQEGLKTEIEQKERKKLLADAEMARNVALHLGNGLNASAAYRKLLMKREQGKSVDPGAEPKSTVS